VSSELLQLRSWGRNERCRVAGPLYHLCSLEETECDARSSTNAQTRRFVFAINRLVFSRLISEPTRGSCRSSKPSAILQDGNVDPEHAPPLGYGHLTTQTEFRQLFETEFDQVAMGLGIFLRPLFYHSSYACTRTGRSLDGFSGNNRTNSRGISHVRSFLYIGKKQ